MFEGWHETALGTPITIGYLPNRHWEAVQHVSMTETGSDCMVCGKSFKTSLYQHLKTYSRGCQVLYNMQRLQQEAEEKKREKRQQMSDEKQKDMNLKNKERTRKQRHQMSDE